MKSTFSLRRWLEARPFRADIAAISLLTLLWALYFWRVLTPNPADQVSLPQGDYSGQFLAFGAYQSERLLAGEIPLWNPYNRGGHPFLADTQAAVFYVPRIITILLSHWFADGWNYAALQAETIAHYWLASISMYLLARSIAHSRIAGIVSAITFAYGGYLTGYPPLQLAVLETAVWLPLGLLGVHKASDADQPKFAWLTLTALSIGMGLLAGHPQTSLYSAYLVIAYLIYRAWSNKLSVIWSIGAIAVAVALGFGLAAVQLLPGLEYTRLTTRANYGYEQLANGFPFSDLISIFLPKVLSVWSPLYNGIASLTLAGIAVASNQKSARFWAAVALVALGLALGRNAILYPIAYLTTPGFALFRGQERAAFVIAIAISILAGMGTRALITHRFSLTEITKSVGQLMIGSWGLAALLFIVERAVPREETYAALRAAAFLALLCSLTWLVIRTSRRSSQFVWQAALVGLVVFDLFSITIGTNWQPIPASDRDLLSDLVPPVVDDTSLYRVDGHLGLGENYGTMIGIQDIRGTSPLWLAALDDYYKLPEARLYQLLSVKYIFTDWQQLTILSEIRAETRDGALPLYLHELPDPTPRAWLVYRVMDTADRNQALGWLADASFDPRNTVILEQQPSLDLPSSPPADSSVTITRYTPERIDLSVSTEADGVLVISEMAYPGWIATVNGKTQPIWTANAGLRALPLKAGTYEITLEYRPLSVYLGLAISVISAITLTLISLRRRKLFTGNE